MGQYASRAKGIWVEGNDEVTVAELANYDFLVAKVGAKFHNNVQHAYDAGKPLIMWYQFRTDIWEGTPLNPSAWPADKNICIQECRSWIMSGMSKRAIHGIVIDASEPANRTDVFWMTMPTKKFMEDMWTEFKLPLYLYLNRNPLNYFPTSTGKESLYNLVKDMDGSSTITVVNTGTDSLPLDGTKPIMDYNQTKVWFWLYKVVGSRLLTLYLQGDKAQLYSDLDFVPANDPGDNTDPGNGDNDNPGTSGSGTVNVNLSEVVALLTQIKTELSRISKHFIA